MNRITLDASQIILGQLNTVAIAWNFSKEMFYLYFKRFLVTCAHSRRSKSLRWQCPWAIWSPWFWLVTRAGKIGPSCSLGIARLIKLVNFRQCWWWSRKKWQNVIKTKEVKTAVVCLLRCKHSWFPIPPLEINELFLIFSRPKVIAKKCGALWAWVHWISFEFFLYLYGW